jgi:hypothetical protein
MEHGEDILFQNLPEQEQDKTDAEATEASIFAQNFEKLCVHNALELQLFSELHYGIGID